MGDLAYPLKIRAHHLLCLLGFRGLGYSDEFVAKMGKVAKELHSNSTLPITVLAECDAICASCPYNRDNQCRKKMGSESRVRKKDLEGLRRLGLVAGEQLPVARAWSRVRGRVTAQDLTEICRECEWLGLGYCAKGLVRLRSEQKEKYGKDSIRRH